MKPINIVSGVDGGGTACVDCLVSGVGCMKNAASLGIIEAAEPVLILIASPS
jgi:hypothetical protein